MNLSLIHKFLITLAVVVLCVLFQEAIFRGRDVEAIRQGGLESSVINMALGQSIQRNAAMYYPSWSPTPGKWLYNPDEMSPLYKLDELSWGQFETPESPMVITVPEINSKIGYTVRDLLQQNGLVYLAYAVSNEEEGLVLIDAYKKALADGHIWDKNLPAPPGKGTAGGDKFYRIHYNVCNDIYQEVAGVKKDIHLFIPMYFDRPGKYEKPGGWVTYLNGAPEWMDYPGRFPMTEKFIKALDELEAGHQ